MGPEERRSRLLLYQEFTDARFLHAKVSGLAETGILEPVPCIWLLMGGSTVAPQHPDNHATANGFLL
ncbi:hypothetical protein XELAEV_18010340mg [Xenopus laevis]|uniref:Uncharacterized protein n=1 Tax=Xenopus laevis TaxID=8355 RepID=A0A974DWG1_XENLA|nr:hypothetical protein XELAEV_18010340mg [Xenopus laevis]